ncbi:MAG TPA: lipoprotein-releasing system transmembrane subunit LolC, partial [Reyranella sp.]|nr:lipoprotein-releasing system transmembrane subunit LolC [Reyranella sp.]
MVERWLAWRYLATRQREGFVSFIAIFSLIGIALGVATLIIVLSVMGGFRASLIGRLIGMNGHVVITAKDGMLRTTPELLEALRSTPDVKTL